MLAKDEGRFAAFVFEIRDAAGPMRLPHDCDGNPQVGVRLHIPFYRFEGLLRCAKLCETRRRIYVDVTGQGQVVQ